MSATLKRFAVDLDFRNAPSMGWECNAYSREGAIHQATTVAEENGWKGEKVTRATARELEPQS